MEDVETWRLNDLPKVTLLVAEQRWKPQPIFWVLSLAFIGSCHSCSLYKGQLYLLRMMGRKARYWYDCHSSPQRPFISCSLLSRWRKQLWGRGGCQLQSCPGEDNRLSVSLGSLCMAWTTELPLKEKLNLSHIPIPVLWLHLQRSWPAFCHHGNLSCCQGVVCVCGWYLKAKSQALLLNYQLPGAIALLHQPASWCFIPEIRGREEMEERSCLSLTGGPF